MKFFIVLIIFISNPIILLGNNLALPCYGCHKNDNNEYNSSIPSLKGITKEYFVKSFYEYKNKIRINYLMQIISQGYSDSEIHELAKYFSNKSSKND